MQIPSKRWSYNESFTFSSLYIYDITLVWMHNILVNVIRKDESGLPLYPFLFIKKKKDFNFFHKEKIIDKEIYNRDIN